MDAIWTERVGATNVTVLQHRNRALGTISLGEPLLVLLLLTIHNQRVRDEQQFRLIVFALLASTSLATNLAASMLAARN